MGVDPVKPPLPAPTEPSTLSTVHRSWTPTELATDVSRRTDRTSYSIPEDGSPITISTSKHDNGVFRGHKSQTSLLIEYFEAGKSGDRVHQRPSVRVKVTPSSKSRKAQLAHDHIQITETGKDRKPSYTRRISLGSKSLDPKPVEITEVSGSSDRSSLTSRLPVEIEVVQNGSDLSGSNVSRERYVQPPSDVSSMPPDSMLEGAVIRTPQRRRSRSLERDTGGGNTNTLKTPLRTRSRSHERIAQRVMEKLKEERIREKSREASGGHKRRGSQDSSFSKDRVTESSSSRRRRSSKSQREDESNSVTESSALTSQLSPSYTSFKSGTSKSSINNPKLLETVEDAIRRLILPELTALKAEQQTQKNQNMFERDLKESTTSEGHTAQEGFSRRLSKSSSAPNVSGKPKVVLNGDADNPGVVLSHGDSVKGRKVRRSSRDSASENSHSRRESPQEQSLRKRSSKDGPSKRPTATAGASGDVLTASTLRNHDSQSTIDRKERRKRSSRSSRTHSRSESVSDNQDETPFATPYQEFIPAMPMQSEIQSSELTRESILSAQTERPQSRSSSGLATPVHEVSRGSPREVSSQASRTPTRTPTALQTGLATFQGNRQLGDLTVSSPQSDRSIAAKAREAALAAAGLGGTAILSGDDQDPEYGEDHASTPKYGQQVSRQGLSPIQSVSSFKDKDSDSSKKPVTPSPSNVSMSSAGTEAQRKTSLFGSLPPWDAKTSVSRERPQVIKLETRQHVLGQDTPFHQEYEYRDELSKENGNGADNFYEKEHEKNDRLRESYLSDESHRDSSLIEYKHMTNYTDDSMDRPYFGSLSAGQAIQDVGANAKVVHTPVAVESAVASLLDPSTMSGLSAPSGHRAVGKDSFDSIYDRNRFARKSNSGSDTERDTVGSEEHSPVKQHWSAIKERAKNLSEQSLAKDLSQQSFPKDAMPGSPRQSLAESSKSKEEIRMVASGLPDVNDPLPEIGHYGDDESEVMTSPPHLQRPLHDSQQYIHVDMSPPQSRGSFGARHAETVGLGEGAVTGANQQHAWPAHDKHATAVQDSYNAGISHGYIAQADKRAVQISPAHLRDEGYMSRTPGGISPDSSRAERYGESLVEDDPFNSAKHLRHLSGNSHGMREALYDSSTGKGIDRIQSKDVVALMDHLTVRDAQRNARDTEILVTLVRSAAEMRNSFEDMRKFIAEQDRMIMKNTDQDAERTVQKILGGPRPQPLSSTGRVRRSAPDDDEDLPTKRQNVFKRALRGLSMRSSNDLANIEGMLVQLLDEVQGLKSAQGIQQRPMTQTNSFNSYENLHTAPDAGYEPEGHAEMSPTPNQSGSFSDPSSRQVNGMRSAHAGPSGSGKRVSTVMEGDEDDLEEHEGVLLDQQYSHEERLLTPTQEARPNNPTSYDSPNQTNAQITPRESEQTPKTAEKHRKHKSTNSSLFDRIPRMSRWSKTTASSAADNRGSNQYVGNGKDRPSSSGSRSGSAVNVTGADAYGEQRHYTVNDDDRLRSGNSLANSALAGERRRSSSPLIPDHQASSPTGARAIDEEEAKYQAHRNSLNLQHPQPRQGSTHRHQSYLESKAMDYDPTDSRSSPDVEMWGSSPSLARLPALNNNRPSGLGAGQGAGRSQGSMPLSPATSEGGYSDRSSRVRDDGPLVPQPQAQPQQRQTQNYQPKEVRREPDAGYSLGFPSPRFEYASPYGSGHQLAPIAEVRRSLESDGGYFRDQQQQNNGNAVGLAPMQSPQRKITGPRPMGSRSPIGEVQEERRSSLGSEKEILGTIRRKPVRNGSGGYD